MNTSARSANARAVAARLLVPVLNGQGSLASLEADLAASGIAERDRGFVKALCYGVCRHHPRLDALAGELLRAPFKQRDSDIQALLLAGLYQLLHMRVPPHAAVSETAGAAKSLGKAWATRVLNGCLRRFQRESVALQGKVDRDSAVALNHPAWLLREIRDAWPEQWREICEANNEPGPMTLRVNRQRVTRDDYLARLHDAGIAATACRFSSDGVQLDAPRDVREIPGFTAGEASVQDESAQLCADLLGPALEGKATAERSPRVLDACSAPGGKSAHLLERFAPALTALDVDPARLSRVEATLERLGLKATLHATDASDVNADADWWDGVAFEAILLDAPCSGTGVIRRHPDIKLTRRHADIAELAALQSRLLDASWAKLAPGGTLLYATCSVLPRENAEQIAAFLARTPEASADLPTDLAWGQPAGVGRQLLPRVAGNDGFFYARLIKRR
ncbi:16S rRNA (cytosine(967)-C(5))-methyltransferase RsmB [Salinicola rhizosphaerae]|uniref:16S rRNA (cytosine(967)-C(5))-methyltransferase n=1 Tax=Salinicola rhizosphaerae TaxID=1443141 RepID=A0ABQ3E298_9GAMM|nr:16S rRNA (cytosine(967)-C(5))-methyltransferase RsmB [Salinicola rhizosphaerae]GHB22480.1 ribosomal RNA small subunit methyltransferase B [Salinicola rhizosphaerae]